MSNRSSRQSMPALPRFGLCPSPAARRIGCWRGGVVASLALSLVSALIVEAALAGAPGPEDEPISEARLGASTPTDEAAGRSSAPATPEPVQPTAPAGSSRPLDPSARLLSGDAASEYWTLFVELDTGHRITQRFLLSNAGPGDHNAVAVGHLVEPGRAPYRYENGRRRARWTLSEDRLFFDIAASHLDLHRPTGELRITKDDIEIRLFFEFGDSGFAGSVPSDRLPDGYHVDLLAVAAATRGTIHAPWMPGPIEARGRTWLAHTWTRSDEAELLDRRIDVYGYENETAFYGLQVRKGRRFDAGWALLSPSRSTVIESPINIPARWRESAPSASSRAARDYPIPARLEFSGGDLTGHISLGSEWLRFDPLAVIPQPFRWFVRRKTKPQEVWAEALIGGTVLLAPDTPSRPQAGRTESASNSKRESGHEAAERSVTGVASITFLNPIDRR